MPEDQAPEDQNQPPENLTPLSAEELAHLTEHPEDLTDELDARLNFTMANTSQDGATSSAPAGDAPPDPPGEGPGSPPSPDGSPAASDAHLPSWLKDLPPEERTKVIEAALASLEPAERAKLGPVSEIANQVAAWAKSQGEQEATARAQAANRTASLDTEVKAFSELLSKDDLTAADLDKGITNLVTVAGDNRARELQQDLTDYLNGFFQQVKLEVPQEVLDVALKQPSMGAAYAVYMGYATQQAFNAGIEHQKTQGEKRSEADAIADRARLRAEIMAELEAEGRLKSDTPPLISAAGSVGGAGELTAAELAEYQRMMERDPLSVPAELEEKVDRHFGRMLAGSASS